MFVATHRFGPFDQLGVPYDVAAAASGRGPLRTAPGRVRRADGGEGSPCLWWARGVPRRARAHAGVLEVAGCRVAGVVSTAPPPSLTGPGGWREAWPVTDDHGEHLASVSVHDRGDVWLPFDPGDLMHVMWSEDYHRLRWQGRVRSELRSAAIRTYYALRPALPRPAQLLLRRRLAHGARGASFPEWPLHTGLHDLLGWLLEQVAGVAGEPVPRIGDWPDGHSWCFVLTHDVETAAGVADIEVLRSAERQHGYRSSWNFVPERYDTPAEVLDRLREEGCEIGVHGLRHDGRDLASARALRRRLPAIRSAADRWGAVGFRSPATQRGWSLMPRLGFDYDSSYTDTDPYEPQPGGCASWLPYFIDDLVELPITLPQDHTLFSILGHRDGRCWVEKSQRLRAAGGMVLVLSHPDYAHGVAAEAWRDLLSTHAGDPSAWQPLARDVASWWRARAASRVVRGPDGWQVVGPAAARARIVLTEPATPRQERAEAR